MKVSDQLRPPRRFSVLILLVLAAAIGVFWFGRLRQSWRDEALARAAADLSGVVQFKAREFGRGLEYHLDDAVSLSRNPLLPRVIENALRSGRGADLVEWVREICDTEGYRMSSIADEHGEIRFSTAPDGPERLGPYLRSLWPRLVASPKPVLTAPHRFENGGRVHQDLVLPFLSGGRPLAALIFVIDLDSEGRGWLEFVPGTSGGGEMEMLWRERRNVVFVRPVRIAGRPAVPLSGNSVEALAVSGHTGRLEGADWEGAPVVAVAAPVADTGFVLLAKRNRNVILAPVRSGEHTALVIFGLAAAALLLSLAIARHRRRERRLRLALQKQSERQQMLQASEEHFRSLVESIPGGVWMSDAKGATTYISPQLASMAGIDTRLGMSEGWLPAIHPDDRPACLAALRGATEKREPFDMVCRLIRPGGEEIALLARGAPRFDAAGKLAGFIGTAADITARQRAEDRLRQLSRAVEQSFAIVFITDVEGSIQYVNPRFTQLTGYTAAEALGQNPRLLASGKTDPELYRRLWSSIRGGGEWRGELLNRKKTGETFWVASTITGIRDDSGVLTHFVAVQEDVTERKAAAEMARRSEAQIRRIVESNLIGTVVFEGDVIVEANPEFLRASGYTREELEAGLVDWRRITLPEHMEVSERAHAQLCNTGLMPPFEKAYLRKDGVLVPVLVGGTSIENSHPPRFVCFVLDLTPIRRSEREIERINGELRRLSAELLRSEDAERRRIARELHDGTAQLLTGISLNLNRIAQHDIPEKDRALLGESMALARQCTDEIRAISYGLHPPLLDELGLATAVEMFARGFEERTSIAVELSMEPEFGRLDRDLELALFRIIQEGLTNVHRHSGSRWAAIRLGRSESGILVEVHDGGNGAGHSPVNGGAAGREGVGLLGMRERAKQFGGEMELMSNGSGTTLRVRLPLSG